MPAHFAGTPILGKVLIHLMQQLHEQMIFQGGHWPLENRERPAYIVKI